MSSDGIVIVGGGQAAAVAAQSLREQGWHGRITMVGRERHRPYERPPLSKAVLAAAEEPALDVLPPDAWARCDVELLGSHEAVELHLAQRQVRLDDGRVLAYHRCLIATGGEARTLAAVPAAHPRVHHVRTLDDARRLRSALRSRPRVAILGGGFLGLEIAHSCLAAGAGVTVVERADLLLDRFLPPDISAWLATELRRAGAQLLQGAAVERVDALADGAGPFHLLTGTGESLAADEVVVAVGMVPNDALARRAGLVIAPGGGVLVDAHCRTSDAHVFACGDCTSQQRPGQARPTRLESWQNANEQARTAAAAMLGTAVPPVPVPWFWTDQGPHNLQMLGLPAADLAYVRHGDPAGAKAVWIGHRAQVPVHGVALNAGADLRALRPLFERAQPVPLQDLQQPALNLRAWAKAALAGTPPIPCHP